MSGKLALVRTRVFCSDNSPHSAATRPSCNYSSRQHGAGHGAHRQTWHFLP
jgi:hypothetical protein